VTHLYLVKLYGSNNCQPHNSLDKLWKWVKRQSEHKAFTKIQDTDHYYRDFTVRASPLIANQLLSENDANILFFRGIPKTQQKTICHGLPVDKTKIQSPLTRDNVLVLLQKEFDEDDLYIETYDTDPSSDSGEDSDSSGSASSDEAMPVKSAWRARRKVRFSTKKGSYGSGVCRQHNLFNYRDLSLASPRIATWANTSHTGTTTRTGHYFMGTGCIKNS
jgi:hypothetical protein